MCRQEMLNFLKIIASELGISPRTVEVYRANDASVAPGEQIVWTRNDPGRRLTNGQRLMVEAVADGRMSLRAEDGRQVTIDTTRAEGRHWDHGYATTIFKSQGRTMRHTLVNAESDRGELFSQKGFLVAISRHTQSVRLFVDDRRRFEGVLARTLGEKTSALDGEGQARQQSRTETLRALVGRLPKGQRGDMAQGARQQQKELLR